MKITRKELRMIVESALNEDRTSTHTVEKGETLSQIYKAAVGVALSQAQIEQLIKMQNDRVDGGDDSLTKIQSAGSIKVGDKILLPGEQAAAAIGAL
jgi:tRNA G37 N-methylase TrmD|tara:strand:+ start:1067 stop:1357 length:291 start_codon:yes stop_codon:yes gene_type:complete